MLINDLIVLERKACEVLAPVHRVQLMSYLKLCNKPPGLLLNFHVALVKDGIIRMKNGH